MQRSFTIICTSLLGICLGSSLSFPSNINIGENGAHTAQPFTLPLHNLSCVIVSALSGINSRLSADQQGGCSQPSRTNMRYFVSPSLTTRTSPNWCRRWIWLKWETASPWHMLVSIAGNLSILGYFPSALVCLSTSQRAFDSKPAQEKIASFVRCTDAWVGLWAELLRGTTEVSSLPSVVTAWFLRSISAAEQSEFLFYFFFIFNIYIYNWSGCASPFLSPSFVLIHKNGLCMGIIERYIKTRWALGNDHHSIHFPDTMITLPTPCVTEVFPYRYCIHFDLVWVCASRTLPHTHLWHLPPWSWMRPAGDLCLPCLSVPLPHVCGSIISKMSIF